MSLKNIFNPDYDVDILGTKQDVSYALVTKKVGRVSVQFAATIQTNNVIIDFPDYLKQHLESYQMGATKRGDLFLLMTFKSDRQDLFNRAFKSALAEEMRDSLNIETILPNGNEDQLAWIVESMEHLNDTLGHLANLRTQNRIRTKTNKELPTIAGHRTALLVIK